MSKGENVTFYVIGIGPGSEEYLTLKALNILKRLDVVLTPKRFESIIRKYNKSCEIIYLDVRNVKNQVIELFKTFKNKEVGILSSGDPLFSGIGKLISYLGYDCEIIPGISSIQIACARVKTSWDNMIFITTHEKEHIKYLDRVVEFCVNNRLKFAILTSPKYLPSKIIDFIRRKILEKYGNIKNACKEVSLPSYDTLVNWLKPTRKRATIHF